MQHILFIIGWKLYECLDSRHDFTFTIFAFIFFFFFNAYCNITLIYCAKDKMHCLYTVHGSHDTIHTFKNYFVIVFLVFSFNKNKLYPNGLYMEVFFFFFFFGNKIYIHIVGEQKLGPLHWA